ncbi:MAG: c-type cytochrome [Opitutaceae bacterium]|nr:c-type cytochrome [Opitutaceae bacterium]
MNLLNSFFSRARGPAAPRLSLLGAVLGSVFLAVTASAAYRIESVPVPPELHGGISAVTFTPSGSLVLTTRAGEVWIRAVDGKTWRRFASGLHEPMGVIADSEREIHVAHRPELLRLRDTDGDGRADTFDALGGGWGLTNNYHELFFGLARDRAGNFYGAASLDSAAEKTPMTHTRGELNAQPAAEKAGHGSDVPWRGWAVQITPDGKTVPFASGFRQPNGIGLSPEGELFVTDNQGDYKPSCGLLHVARGDFHGHAESLKWEPGYQPGRLTPEILWRRYKGPAVVFPHGVMGVSSGEPVWDLTRGKFGPYAGQVFCGDYSNIVTRSGLENVAGAWQGFVFPFLGRTEIPPYATGERLGAGATRAAFGPDGALYLAETAGWGAGQDGFQRVTWDGTLPADVHSMQLTARGFVLTFTKPMNPAELANPANFEFDRFRFYYHVKYGSPWIDEAKVPVTEVRPSADGRRVEVTLAEMQAGFVYQISVGNLHTAEGEPLANPIGYYTANRLLDGTVAIGGTTRLAREGEASLGAKESPADAAQTGPVLVAAGEKVYKLFCVACHQPDGRGLPGGAANFVEDKTRLAKTDVQLMESLTKGTEKGMPPFGTVLGKTQQRAVLAYVRATFGEKP